MSYAPILPIVRLHLKKKKKKKKKKTKNSIKTDSGDEAAIASDTSLGHIPLIIWGRGRAGKFACPRHKLFTRYSTTLRDGVGRY